MVPQGHQRQGPRGNLGTALLVRQVPYKVHMLALGNASVIQNLSTREYNHGGR
jgi:hypothetical protein